MSLTQINRKPIGRLVLFIVCAAFPVTMMAQVETQKAVSHGQTSREVTVERGEVVYVSGNDLVVKMENGETRFFPNVPDSARITVEGRQLSVHDLKPGMKLQRTITTTTTPTVIHTVETVTGTIWQVTPPNSVILTLENGKNQRFKIPKGQKFNVGGQMVDAFQLKKGMKISATKIVTEPLTVVSQQRHVTGEMPPPPPPPPADVPILIVEMRPAPAPAPKAEPAPEALPKTASPVPLIGLLGLLSLGLGVGLCAIRKFA